MRRQSGALPAILLILAGAACADTDVENTEEARERLGNGDGVELEVTSVDLESQRWFREGRAVEFGNRKWIITGEPLYDPAVTPVGEFEGTQLFAEVGTSAPYSKLFIPLENDQWQMLTPGSPGEPGEGDVPQGVPGVEDVGDPRPDPDGR
ncbi:MAG TPA: hypothetical protein VK966_07370 [Longimicrobiales bacterium]|nr:hypothetical protein [Longimicrobiales bacterium]